MNMIAGAKVSIVDPTPGVTRDRVSAIVDIQHPDGDMRGPRKPVEFVDTGGFGVYTAQGERFDEIGNDLHTLTTDIETQIARAVEDADLVLFAVDAQAGVTTHDQEIARLLREHRLGGKKAKGAKRSEETVGKKNIKTPPIRIVATKVDGPKWEAHAHEIAGLGFGDPIPVSSKTNYFRRDFMDALYAILPEPTPEDSKRVQADLLVAIIGKRNAGKSTLVNALAGEPRVIVSEIAGTTRDAVDVRFEMLGKTIVAVDTAGLRRKRSFQNMIEHFALDRMQRSVDRADVLLLMIDATEKISQVDEQVAMMATKSFKPTVIVVNKWDAVEGRRNDKGKLISPGMYEEYLRKELRGLWFAPIIFISGETGLNVQETIKLAMEMKAQAQERVTTGKLNRLVRAILDQRGPSDIKGRWAKVYYVAQTGTEPPTITLVVNTPELFTPNYLRFLMNRFREELPFTEVPIRIVIRARRQREDDMLTAGSEGEGESVRVTRGRKGVSERITGRRAEGHNIAEDGMEFSSGELVEGMGEELLSDEYSESVGHDFNEDDAESYFNVGGDDEDEGDDTEE